MKVVYSPEVTSLLRSIGLRKVWQARNPTSARREEIRDLERYALTRKLAELHVEIDRLRARFDDFDDAGEQE
jgi:hypothetical protein